MSPHDGSIRGGRSEDVDARKLDARKLDPTEADPAVAGVQRNGAPTAPEWCIGIDQRNARIFHVIRNLVLCMRLRGRTKRRRQARIVHVALVAAATWRETRPTIIEEL